MGNSLSKPDVSGRAAVRVEEQDNGKWKEAIDAVASLNLEEMTRGELDAFETVLRQQLVFERKEEERLRRAEIEYIRKISSSSMQSFDSAPNSPRKRRVTTVDVPQADASKCPQCGVQRQCIEQQLCFPEASKLMEWSACHECALQNGLQVASGKWYHGNNTHNFIALSEALLKRILECQPTARVEDSLAAPPWVVGELGTVEEEETSNIYTPASATSTLSRSTLKRKGNNWTGRLQACISHDKASKSLNVAITKVLDLVDMEANCPIGVQVSLMPQRSSADCQISSVSPSRGNGSVEFEQLLTWPELKRKQLSSLTLEISVWVARPLELLGKADVQLSFLLKRKGDNSPHFFSLFHNSNVKMYDQVVAMPAFAFTFHGADHDTRRSTEYLVAVAETSELFRISSTSDVREENGSIIELMPPDSAGMEDQFIFEANDAEGVFLNRKSFQKETLRRSSTQDTQDTSMKDFEAEINEVSSQLDMLDEAERGTTSMTAEEEKGREEPVYAQVRHSQPTLVDVAEGLEKPESEGDRLSDRGVIVVTDEHGGVRKRGSFMVPKVKASLGSTGGNSNTSRETSPESSLVEADRIIRQTPWTDRSEKPVQSYSPTAHASKPIDAYDPTAEQDWETKGIPNPYGDVTGDPQMAQKGKTLTHDSSRESPSSVQDSPRTDSPVSTTDRKSAYSTSVRLSIVEVRPYTLDVTVHQVKNINRFHGEEKLVPTGVYCKIYMNADGKKFKAKTRVVPYDSNVTFDETLTLNGRLKSAELEVMVWETHGLVGRHLMTCTCHVLLAHLHLKRQVPVTHWYKLMQPMPLHPDSPSRAGELKRVPSKGSLSSWVFHKHR